MVWWLYPVSEVLWKWNHQLYWSVTNQVRYGICNWIFCCSSMCLTFFRFLLMTFRETLSLFRSMNWNIRHWQWLIIEHLFYLKYDVLIVWYFIWRYTGPLLEEGSLEKALDGGPKSVEYTGLVEWLSKELQTLCKLDEHVNAVSSAEDSSSFLLELSSFLKELGKYVENCFV